jgi:UDP-GlcNAc:undecaprenyl-phosphate GlcNAc-1-phosphate transferase
MLLNNLLIVIIGFVLGLIASVLFKSFALGRKILLRNNVPLIGGLGIGLAFLIACLFGFSQLGWLSPQIKGIIIASLLMLFFGLVDDLKESSIIAKFFMQIIATFVLIAFGVKIQIAYIGNVLNTLVTFLWVLGIANAFNHLDVMDGLASAVAAIVSLSFCLIAILNSDFQVAILCLALSGAIIGFLSNNLPPAKIYMGNSGSHFLGFILAGVAMVISYAPVLDKKIALLSPLLILGLPIFDSGFLVLMRLSKRKLPFKKSNDHLPLRYLVKGYSRERTLFNMLGLCLFFCFCGILVSQVSNTKATGLLVLALVVSLLISWDMSKITVHD